MNTAVVLPPYDAFGGSSDGSQDVSMQFGVPIPTSRMAQKRRRIDDSSGEYGNPTESWEAAQQQRHQQAGQQYGHSAIFGNAANSGEVEYAGAAANAASGGESTGVAASTLNEPSDPSTQWHGASGVSPYPDVSYSQQPYFFQQTHPSAYNSPWPPGGEGASFATQTSVYPSTSAPSTSEMPYFPPNNQTDGGEFGGTSSLQQQALVQGFAADAIAAPAQFSYASGNENGMARSDVPPEASAFLYEDASMHLKIQSLPILENLATQLIHTIAKASFPQIQEIMLGNDDEDSQAYTTLKNLFDQTRKVYSCETAFIDAIAIQMFQPNQQEIIRKANIATFLSSILGAHDVSFFHLNEFFMETFVPLGHRLLKWQGAIYLELKTQTYISALINSDGSPEAMLDELFPPDLDAQILTRHPDAPSLSPSEQDFIDRSRARKSYLLAENSTEEAIMELPKKYQWQDFVREFASSINKNADGVMNTPTRNLPSFGANGMDKRTSAAAAALDTLSKRTSGSAALSGVQALTLNGSSGQASGSGQSREDGKRSSAAASSIRQPWTKPEEDALLSGLDRVSGPHWSQILALYGRGGSVSEVLKDRNQVQLKDKARNLKLWYLKMGKEVPPALKGVTGELRKRGGARARAAMGVVDEDEQGDGDHDAEGEVELEGSDQGASQTTRSGRASGRRKSKKGS